MKLSNDLVEQFVNATVNESKDEQNDMLYGTVVVFDGKMYVRLDGSEQLTPIKTTTNIREGDRVTVNVKKHSALITGNMSSPSATVTDLLETNSAIAKCGELIATKVSTDELNAATGRIQTLETDYLTVNGNLEAATGKINELEADKLSVNDANAKFATIDTLRATNADIDSLTGNYSEFKKSTIEQLKADSADISELQANKLSATDADLKYANIDFTNIGVAAIKQFYATSGIIKDLVIGDQTVTGEIVGVTIKGDLIEGNTIIADKLVMKGDDGIFYKLNMSAANGVNAEQTSYNSINGSIITAKSITATQISVKDLVAFDATIAGFKIRDTAIYSTGKESATSTVRGIYLGKDGQIGFGDGNNYIKFYIDTDGKYKLGISAENLTFSSGQSVKGAIDDVNSKVNAIKSIDSTTIGYLVGDSGTTPPTGIWSTGVPVVPNGKYLWCQKITTYTDGSHDTEYSVSKTGDKGEQGVPGLQGIQGEKGDQGIQGPKGDIGATGPQGPQGIQGKQGPQGNAGPTGAAGKGVKSTAVTYQASASATSAPTGTWSGSPVTTSASLPYMWTRTIITYTDNTTSTSYSVGCTPEGVSVGGRNLIRGSGKISTDFALGSGTIINNGYNGNKAVQTTGAWSGPYIHLNDILNRNKITVGTTLTVSIYVSTTSTSEITTPGIYLYRGNGDDQTGAFGALKLIAGRWVKISKTYKISTALSSIRNTMRFESSASTSYNILWSAPKLEIGNKATDWSPAPEDQVAVGDVVNQVNSELKMSDNSIALTTGHFTISSKNLSLDSAGNATFSGTVKAASVEGSMITGGTISGSNGTFNTGFAIRVSDHSNAVFYVDDAGNTTCKNLEVTNGIKLDGDIKSNGSISVLKNIDVNGTISGSTIDGLNRAINANSTSIDTLKNSKITCYDMSDSSHTMNSNSIGTMIDCDGGSRYYGTWMFNCGWIHMEMRCTASAFWIRTKYGDNAWGSWHEFFGTKYAYRTQTRSFSQAANCDDHWTFYDLGGISGLTRVHCMASFSGTGSSFMNAYQYNFGDGYTDIRTSNYGGGQFNGQCRVTVIYML